MEIYENLDINDLDEEVWKDILDYKDDYQVSNLGRVKSFIKWNGTNCRILKQYKNIKNEYLYVNLHQNKKYIHNLVYETHKRKLEKEYDIHHINENKKDNCIDNLESKPHSDHIRNHMKYKHLSKKTKTILSVKRKGEKNPNYKKTNQEIISIKIDIKKGDLTQIEMAKKYGINQTTISKIKTGKLWSHIKI